MSIISGKYNNKDDLKKITDFMVNRSKNENGNFVANHIWANDQPSDILSIIDKVRKSDKIYTAIQNNFPNHRIKNVTESDELYFAVSPQDADGSDRSLVDNHYDAPFGGLPTFNNIYYRVIIACNPNDTVTTTFPNDNVSVRMDNGDFHGLDYNLDLHSATGEIPPNKHRVLLKLHYILVPKEYDDGSFSENYVRSINVAWTGFSREFMRMSAHPNNALEYVMGASVNVARFCFNNIWVILIFLIILIAITYRDKISNLFQKDKNNSKSFFQRHLKY